MGPIQSGINQVLGLGAAGAILTQRAGDVAAAAQAVTTPEAKAVTNRPNKQAALAMQRVKDKVTQRRNQRQQLIQLTDTIATSKKKIGEYAI